MSDAHEDKTDKEEARRHSESLFWAELKPRLFGALGAALLLATIFVGISSGMGWALFPLAGAAFSFYEAKVAQNEFYLRSTQAVSDVDSEQWTRNLAESQVKAQNQQVESAPPAPAQNNLVGAPTANAVESKTYEQNTRTDGKTWVQATGKEGVAKQLVPVSAATPAVDPTAVHMQI